MANFNFVSIPRNASNTLHYLFETKYKKNHLPITQFTNQSILSFAFVREPISRLQSWFHFHKVMENHPEYSGDFADWVDNNCPHHWTNGIDPRCQYDFICNDRKILVNFIGVCSQNRFTDDIKFISDYTGTKLPINIPVLNNCPVTPGLVPDSVRERLKFYSKKISYYGNMLFPGLKTVKINYCSINIPRTFLTPGNSEHEIPR